jgi:hypothetical protein
MVCAPRKSGCELAGVGPPTSADANQPGFLIEVGLDSPKHWPISCARNGA